MSPEQARGHAVDKRTDIWAFGCVLYELLARRTAFGRETVTDTLVAIIERDPDWAALPAETPEAIVRLLRRCLDKDVKARLRDIADARLEIDEALAGAERAQTTRTHSRSIAAAVLALAVVALAYWALTRRSHRRA
jgi:serine/threonine protein kinase